MKSTEINNKVVKIEKIPIEELTSSSRPFIQANTQSSSLQEIEEKHIIPVFIKDNEPVISHGDFIASTQDIVGRIYEGESILKPAIRISHPIKGRVPEARNKPAKELKEHEKTIYYERMAFVIEVPSVYDTINGHRLSLTIGGVKAYNLDNLYNRKGSDEHFKVFIGFENKVCTNLCIWSDGYTQDLRVHSLSQLQSAIYQLLVDYDAVRHMSYLKKFTRYNLSEEQFARMIGRCRMYHYMPKGEKECIPPLEFGDSQINAVCRDYYRDASFCRQENGDINLWKLYNLFTSANRSSYIDRFLDRGLNAFFFCDELRDALDHSRTNWFLN